MSARAKIPRSLRRWATPRMVRLLETSFRSGYQCRCVNSHVGLWSPDGRRVWTTGSSPSRGSSRALLNSTADLRRALTSEGVLSPNR